MYKTFHYYGYKRSRDNSKKLAISGVVIGNTMRVGIATCNYEDQFRKKTGRELSIGKAIACPNEIIDLTNKNLNRLSDIFLQYCKKRSKTPLGTGKKMEHKLSGMIQLAPVFTENAEENDLALTIEL